MADAELPGAGRGLSPAAEEQARTSAEAARSLAGSLRLPEPAAAADRAFLDAMYAATLSIAALALLGFAVSAVGLRPRAAPAGRERTPPPAEPVSKGSARRQRRRPVRSSSPGGTGASVWP
ncbi:hypothetical protein [Streptomyces heilongjiangensis]|uniref:MFS transporter n=1 Tax=Streptomyces heilongjiangensis TaxID=945052 RepID=A0ABW1B235_9ACTN|nr:hypothetical protein [Streptomyces heilongjiangensis]MDC2948120.1 hypothetical protein [Streptomyces heilongjiangensis]